jgi:hypothetical protein
MKGPEDKAEENHYKSNGHIWGVKMNTMRYTDNDKTIYANQCSFCVNSEINRDVICTLGIKPEDQCPKFVPVTDVEARMKLLTELLPDKYGKPENDN